MIDTAELEGRLEAAAERACAELGCTHVTIIGFWSDDGRGVACDGGTTPLHPAEMYAQLLQQHGGLAYLLQRLAKRVNAA